VPVDVVEEPVDRLGRGREALVAVEEVRREPVLDWRIAVDILRYQHEVLVEMIIHVHPAWGNIGRALMRGMGSMLGLLSRCALRDLVLGEEVVIYGGVDQDMVLAVDDGRLACLKRRAHDVVKRGEEIVPQ
jgi:adenine deaminase